MSDENNIKSENTLKDFLKKYKTLIISFSIISIVLIISIILLKEYKEKENILISQKFNSAKILVEKKDINLASKILEEIIYKKNVFYSPSSLNLIVEKNLINDKNKIISFYDEIISIPGLDKETKNLFILKKVIFLGDQISENDLLTNLKPIIQSQSIWKNTVSNYIYKYYLSKNEFNKAKNFKN